MPIITIRVPDPEPPTKGELGIGPDGEVVWFFLDFNGCFSLVSGIIVHSGKTLLKVGTTTTIDRNLYKKFIGKLIVEQ